VVRDLAMVIPPAARTRVQHLIVELMGHDDASPRRLASTALDLGSRIALTVTGNLEAALFALLRLRGKQPDSIHDPDTLELCRTDPALRALLSFAISEQYIEARREDWAQAVQETA